MNYHVVCYYLEDDVSSELLQRPTALPEVMDLIIPPELVKFTSLRHPPRIEPAANGQLQV